MFSIDGIVSGFDSTGIIDSLLGFQQSQIDTFNTRKADIATEQSAFKGIEAQLLTLRSSLSQLNRTQSSVFDVKSAISSHEDILNVVADSGANEGVYQLTVESLATAHQIGSQGFSASTEQIAQGTVTFKVGDRAATTITIDQGNNSLQSFVAAVNDQVSDVNAGIIYDQGTDSYRVLLTSKETGASNEIVVTSDQNGATGAIVDFSGPAVQEATDAVVRLGSGPGAISASFASNQIDNLIEDVTIDLLSAKPDTTVTIRLEADTSKSQEAIESFVADYNSVIDFIESQTRFVPETNQSSPLLGNRSVSTIKNQLFAAVTDTITSNASVRRLSQIGIDVNTKGRLVVDSGKLSQALRGDIDGVEPKDIRKLFGLNAESTNSGIEFLAGGNRTVDSKTPYQVDITQAAEQATVTATNSLASSVVIDETNNEFTVTLDGIVSETLTLASGTYTQSEIAAHFQNTINGSETLGVHQVAVSVDTGGNLVVTSEAYGSASKLSSVSGSAASVLGFTGSESDVGQDVAGKFIINGVEEIAKGSGRLLIGDSENENTADLQLLITMTSDQVVAGVDADIQVSRGVSGRLDQFIGKLLDPDTGLLKTVEDDFDARIESIDKSIERVEEITAAKRESLLAEFTALESIISELQNTGSFITNQLASIGPIGSNKK
ncbi:flagellar filament capping protein FliD [Stieleria varia]|uniref:Flagellar hook-associated protein 2 n=1 Tax=Stieleria varia TaxID=2528005 RepID=A0A5C6AVK2_9BACT|nr:flagellar filament capping protein FliD [Stieleria varia]TWU02154.1 Flagellar hook-associated protein 2 [Stieleria varia]